jgi:hypothetical protein
VLCSIITEYGVSVKPVGISKMCLNETYSKVGKGKHLSDAYLNQNRH